MRILQLSDLHINTTAKRKMTFFFTKKHLSIAEERINRIYYFLHKLVREQEKKIDLIVFSGDIFDKRIPLAEDYASFIEILYYIKETLDTPYCILSGNHDDETSLRKSPLHTLEHLFTEKRDNYQEHTGFRKGFAVSEPQIFSIQGFNVILCPWGTSYTQMSALKEYVKDYSGMYFMHVGVNDGKSHWAETELESGVISLQSLKELQSAIGIGHFHGQMELANNIWYCGSPECYNFGEENQEKGALIWEIIQGESIKAVPISAPYLHYKTYGINFLQIEDNLQDKQCYIRLKAEVTLEQYKLLLEKVKKHTCLGAYVQLQFYKNDYKNIRFIRPKGNEAFIKILLDKNKNLSDEHKKDVLEKHYSVDKELGL